MESHDASASKKPRRSAGPGSLTALTLRLAKHFAAAEQSSSTENGGGGGSKNLIFSPLSVYAALALVAAGAQGGTLDELLAALGAASRDELAEFVRGVAERALADGSGSGGPRVAFACGVWHDQTRPLKPAYRDAAVASYKATTRAVDFREQSSAAVEEINRWVAEATHNLIPGVLSPSSVNPRTRLVLANAIYFKGKWDKPFSKDSTKTDKFHRLDGTAVDAPMMCKSRGRQLIAVHDGFKVLMLPYKAPVVAAFRVGRNATTNQRRDPITQYHMCIFLPDARDGLWSLVDKMASSGPDFLHDHLPTETVGLGTLQLPKFKTEFSSKLTGALGDMGIAAAFDAGKADLSDMAEDDGSGLPLVVRDVFHKAVIEVNEEGTEAAAVTYTVMIGAARPPRVTVDFIADHPFLFFIIEKVSSAVVFAGYSLRF